MTTAGHTPPPEADSSAVEPHAEIHEGFQFTKILRKGAWYFLASFLTKGAALLLVPIYTRYVPPEGYGILGSIDAIARLGPFIMSFSLDAAFTRFYYEERRISQARVRALYSTQFWFVAIWGTIVLLLGFAVSSATIEPLLDVPFWPFVPLALLIPLFAQLGIMGARVYRAELRAREVSLITSASVGISAVVSLTLLLGFDLGVLALLWGALAGPVTSFVVFAWIAVRRRWLTFTFDWRVLRRGLAYSVPLMPVLASNWIKGTSDRLILAGYQDLAEVGLYTMSVQIALLMFMIGTSVNQVQGHMAMSALTANVEEGKRLLSRFLTTFLWSLLFFYLGLVFFSKEIVTLALDDRYATVWQLVAVLAIAYVMQSAYRVFMHILSYHKKLWMMSAGVVPAALINLVLNFVFIPVYGQVAAAVTTALSTAIYLAWVVWCAQRVDPLQIAWGAIGLTLGAAALAVAAYLGLELTEPGGDVTTLVLKTGVLALFAATLLLPGLRAVREDAAETAFRGVAWFRGRRT